MAAKILHITLAFLIYISSAGLVLNQHYCRQELKDAAFFVKAPNCHEAMAEGGPPACPMHQENPAEGHEKGCCDDESSYLKIDQPQSFDLPVLDLHPALYPPLHHPCFSTLSSLEQRTVHYRNYKPPPLVCDLPIVLQTFRC